MIYIKTDTNLVQSISIPKYFGDPVGAVKLKLVNNLTEQVAEIVPTSVHIVDPYIQLEFQTAQSIVDGEYSYNLTDSNGVISFGIAVVGDYKRAIQSYQKESKKIQYKG